MLTFGKRQALEPAIFIPYPERQRVLMLGFILAIAFTLGVSAFCSLLEALILSTTTSEIEALKKKHAHAGLLLEEQKKEINETISTILTLNTIANTLGGILVGAIAVELFGQIWLGVVSGGMTVAILLFSEVIPKNIGIVYRTRLQRYVVYPLVYMRAFLKPLTYLCEIAVRVVIRSEFIAKPGDEEIILLAEKSAQEGHLTKSALSMVANALTLDNVRISEIMTPRTVVTAIDKNLTVREVVQQFRNIPFARMPVYDESPDEIVGMVRRRDLLHALANGEEDKRVDELKDEIHFIPETVTGAAALQTFLRTHQQLAVVVDEFGSVAGVITMEDIMEYIIGREIFEKDDMAVDMRELARARNLLEKKRQQIQRDGNADPPPDQLP